MGKNWKICSTYEPEDGYSCFDLAGVIDYHNKDNKYIEKFNKRIIIPDTIEKILNMIKWENKNENVFIAGGFALALYNNFKILWIVKLN